MKKAIVVLIAWHMAFGLAAQKSRNNMLWLQYGPAFPLSDFNTFAFNSKHPLSSARTGFAFRCGFDKYLNEQFMLNLTFLGSFYPLHNHEFEKKLGLDLNFADYYVTGHADLDYYAYFNNSFLLGLKRTFRSGRWVFEPCLSVGWNLFGSDFQDTFHAKKKGSNYFEDIAIKFDEGPNGSLAIATSFNTVFLSAKRIGYAIGLEFWHSKVKTTYTSTSVNIYGETKAMSVSLGKGISTVNLSLGIIYRV